MPMARWIRSLSRRIASWAPALLTLAALAGLGFWGSRNDWQLPAYLRSGDQATASPQTAAEPSVQLHAAPPSSGPGSGDSPAAGGRPRLEFPSAEAVRKAGIRVVPAQERDLARYVVANGAVDYDPSRYVRLTARTAGIVWRVYKEIGEPVRQGEVLAL